MGFLWKKLENVKSTHNLEEMATSLKKIPDIAWGRYAFSREPLEGKFTLEQKNAYTKAASRCGEEQANHMITAYGTRNPETILHAMGVKLKSVNAPIGGGQVLFAQYAFPDEITIYTDCLNRAMVMEGILPSREELRKILLAHELFHAIEVRNSDIYTRTEKIELWRRPFSNRSPIACLSEIAAMSFAKTLLDMTWNPYVLDVLLVFLYDQQAAGELYEEVCQLTKESYLC